MLAICGIMQGHDNHFELSPRQHEVLQQLTQGSRVEQISYALGIKPETVNLHIRKLRSKLGAQTNAQAVAIAYENNLLKLPTLS